MAAPPSAAVASASLEAHFGKRRALVFGSTLSNKQKWRKIFMFDYGQGKQIAAVPVGKSEYINFAAFEPKGDRAFIEVRDLKGGTRALKVFDFTTSQFADVTLPPPPSDIKKSAEK